MTVIYHFRKTKTTFQKVTLKILQKKHAFNKVFSVRKISDYLVLKSIT